MCVASYNQFAECTPFRHSPSTTDVATMHVTNITPAMIHQSVLIGVKVFATGGFLVRPAMSSG